MASPLLSRRKLSYSAWTDGARATVTRWRIGAVLALSLVAVTACRLGTTPGNSAVGAAAQKQVMVLGIDGMDPQLLERFMAAGKMPNFSRLAAADGVHRLGTSNPAQSPVAWSNLITGMNPGGHGIFDFIHRDPTTLAPFLSTSRVDPPKHSISIGHWVFPVSSGHTLLLRHGKAFWEYLDEYKIPALIYRMPANFPPVATKARTLSGMGTPDVLGTYGTFSFYTDDLFFPSGTVNGGRVYPVSLEHSRVAAKLYGPYNTFRKGDPQSSVDFTVVVDPASPVAKISLQGHDFLLAEGEWSAWIPVTFDLLPHLASVKGICRFHLRQAHPRLQLYVTPVNMDPADPALPISTPDAYSRELDEDLGPFYTQGIAEDTKALSTGVFADQDYLQQAQLVLAEQSRAFDRELTRYRAGLFFFYFSSIDLNSHMFWRAMDPGHPGYSAEAGEQYGAVIEQLYTEMDKALGKALARLGPQGTLVVLSDHGFAPYYRSFNLNTWLLEQGYIALQPGAERSGDYFAHVDWAHTRAYGLGLNGLYLNLRGRERDGVVTPGMEANALLDEIRARLLALRDPASGATPITRIDKATEAYSGPYVSEAPDMLIGYNRGYRAGWGTVLGSFPEGILEDNLDPWSGDHCMDFTLVPGILVSNRKLTAESPALTDVAPTILAEFGIERPQQMSGRALFSPVSPPRP